MFSLSSMASLFSLIINDWSAGVPFLLTTQAVFDLVFELHKLVSGLASSSLDDMIIGLGAVDDECFLKIWYPFCIGTQLEAENEVNNEMANRMSLFYAEATPMLKTLSNATTKFVSEVERILVWSLSVLSRSPDLILIASVIESKHQAKVTRNWLRRDPKNKSRERSRWFSCTGDSLET